MLLQFLNLNLNSKVPRGSGSVVKWTIQGTLRGIEWKWICTCIDLKTGTTAVATKSSRNGAMEWAFEDLFKKLARQGDL